MIIPHLLKAIAPLACQWVEQQERQILEKGVPLDEDQQIDAYLIGVKDIEKVRLLPVDSVPAPFPAALKNAAVMAGFAPNRIIGTSFRYGIYIRTDRWNQRELVAHELTHTMQYEKLGLPSFIEQYVLECLTVGYPEGALEKEARQTARKICSR